MEIGVRGLGGLGVRVSPGRSRLGPLPARSQSCVRHSSKEPQPPPGPLRCPECGSQKVGKDGLRPLADSSMVQRWLCRDCGLRFSLDGPGRPLPKEAGRRLNIDDGVPSGRQVCATIAGVAKNLDTATEIKTVAGEFGTLEQDARILQYEWKCKNRQLGGNTIKKRKYYLNRLVRDGADLDKPESVETVLATHYPTATKWVMVIAYRSYCKMFNIAWEPVKIKYTPKMPYMPTEEECRTFIAAMPKVLMVLCQTLFETGARVGELTRIQRQDVNVEECKIAIRCPEKGSNPRIVKVLRECIELLMTLPKKHEPYLFNPEHWPTMDTSRTSVRRQPPN